MSFSQRFLNGALPFYLVFLNIPVVAMIASLGGWAIFFGYIYFLFAFAIGDRVFGDNADNLDPQTKDDALKWYILVTKIWPYAQAVLLVFVLVSVNHLHNFTFAERAFIMFLTGMSNALAGIVIAHELVHQKNRYEQFLGDFLLSMTLYGHFRTEHVHGHHRYVATPRDPATARYNENFYAFALRVIPMSFISAWGIEKGFLERRGLPIWHRTNPFWRYGILALFWIVLSVTIGGWHGVLQFVTQAVTAIIVLELTNYIEHYGLVRLHKGEGKYEHIALRHSWNANHKVTNYYLINLQRHSDHHYKPNRRFPLLQAVDETEAPQLPYGYTVMALIALFPNYWRRVMNPRVRRWRSMYYPQIVDWSPYNKGTTPWPR